MPTRHVRQVPSANRPPPQSEVLNRLLAALPADDYARISRAIDIVPLELKKTLQKPGDPIAHAYFPGGGFVSILTVLEDGTQVEIATIGREGVAGPLAASNSDPSPTQTLVQAATDTCYRMPVAVFRREMDQRSAFYALITRYVHAYMTGIMQTTACNAVHSVEQRLARWLLTAQDRVNANDFPLTQEFVAMMLGVTRPTVTVVAGTLQRAGLIEYKRGHLTILDREKLESASCECYHTVTALLNRITGNSAERTRKPSRTLR